MEIIYLAIAWIVGLENGKLLIGRQTNVEEVPFYHKIWKMNSCTFVLYGETLCHSSDGKCPQRRSWVKPCPLLSGASNMLTPKGPLSLRRTNGISGRYLRADFLSWFFETFLEDRKTDYLYGNVNFFQPMPMNKSYVQVSSKNGTGGNNKSFKI